MTRPINIILISVGILLFGVNISGFFIPLRSPQIYELMPDQTLLTTSQFYTQLNHKTESQQAYVTHLNQVVHEGIASYGNHVDQLNGHIPFYENYLLFIAGFVYPRAYYPYEFCNPQKAIERGIGICSQQAIILIELLKEKNIDAHIVGLSGHVVATAQIDKNQNSWWILDPYYNKVIPYDLKQIEQNPELVRPFYLNQSNEDMLVSIYGKTGNTIYEDTRAYSGWKKYDIEQLSYIFIWVIPILCIFFAIRPPLPPADALSISTAPSKYVTPIQ